ncbi:MAG: methyltransferase domain-containing protein [Verrucomicrobiales bacterium]|nr:methyltransferase domain-containing protein [Verrucomicrobiales bacterium]
MQTESAVKQRYAAGANAQEAALCCPVDYDPHYLKVIPAEVIERDYGCGDPSKYVRQGETVLDLGSGTGKICFIASQVVGPQGKVIGIDMTDDMLEVARRNTPVVAERIGHDNVEFRKGRIQDLSLDLELLETKLKSNPVDSANAYLQTEELVARLSAEQPLVASGSVDVVVSNCVLNLVSTSARQQLFSEIYRVLKNGGRAVISDIVCDEDVPQEMQDDDHLWSGCISGAYREDDFLQAFEAAGFHGVQILQLDKKPWQTVNGIEFRSMTIEAFKGGQGPCIERNQAVIYKGPFKSVLDDDGHPMERGKRYAVCEKTYNLYKRPPYADFFEFVDPLTVVPSDPTNTFDCKTTRLRAPKETKGDSYTATTAASDCCGPGTSCC